MTRAQTLASVAPKHTRVSHSGGYFQALPPPTTRAETTPHTWASAAEGRSQSQMQPKVASEWSDADADRRLTFASALAHHVKTKSGTAGWTAQQAGTNGSGPR